MVQLGGQLRAHRRVGLCRTRLSAGLVSFTGVSVPQGRSRRDTGKTDSCHLPFASSPEVRVVNRVCF